MMVDIFRIVDGKLVEYRDVTDALDFLKQLGITKYTEKGKKLFKKMPSNCLGQHFSNPHAYRVVVEHCRIIPINSTFQFFYMHHNHVGSSYRFKNEDSSLISLEASRTC